jgi:hypothetical protein
LGLTVWGAHDLLRVEGVAVGHGDRAETLASLAGVTDELGNSTG